MRITILEPDTVYGPALPTQLPNPANRLYGLIALRAVIIYRPETQTNKLKLTLANSSLLSVFCH